MKVDGAYIIECEPLTSASIEYLVNFISVYGSKAKTKTTATRSPPIIIGHADIILKSVVQNRPYNGTEEAATVDEEEAEEKIDADDDGEINKKRMRSIKEARKKRKYNKKNSRDAVVSKKQELRQREPRKRRSRGVDCIPHKVVLTTMGSDYNAEIDNPLLSISSEMLTHLLGIDYRGRYYAFMMSHPFEGKKTTAFGGFSGCPMMDVSLHNDHKLRDRATSAVAPHWYLNMAIGPFGSLRQAQMCSDEWAGDSRGLGPKEKLGVFLGRVNNKDVFYYNVHDDVPFEDYLREKCPPHYLSSYRSFKHTCLL